MIDYAQNCKKAGGRPREDGLEAQHIQAFFRRVFDRLLNIKSC